MLRIPLHFDTAPDPLIVKADPDPTLIRNTAFNKENLLKYLLCESILITFYLQGDLYDPRVEPVHPHRRRIRRPLHRSPLRTRRFHGSHRVGRLYIPSVQEVDTHFIY